MRKLSDYQDMIQWQLESKPTPQADIPYYNMHYLYGCDTPADPTIVWGTEVDMQEHRQYLKVRNRTSKSLLSPAHVLLQATGRALGEFPQLNVRVVGKKIFAFRETNVRIVTYNKVQNEVDIQLIRNADQIELERVARLLWKYQHKTTRRDSLDHETFDRVKRLPSWILKRITRLYFWADSNFRLPKSRFDRVSASPVVVNYLGFAGAPSMRAYKPSNYPDEGSNLSITMGRIEDRPVARNGEVVVRPVAPLFVRADHRVADAYVLAQFLNKLTRLLADPAQMEPTQEHIPQNEQPNQEAKAA